MGFATIIALDLGKFKSVACVMNAATRTHRFETIDTTPQRLHELFTAHATAEGSPSTLAVVECCDAAGWVHDLATSLGLAVKVANCRHEAWRWSKVKRKTDKDDALKLAKMTLSDELPTVHVPSPPRRQKRRLIPHRRSLVARRTQCKNAIRSIFSQQGLSEHLPRGSKAWTQAGVEQLAADARPLDECGPDDLWRGRLHLELQLLDVLHEQVLAAERKLDELARDDDRVALLETVPGVGTRLAEAVVSCIDDPRRFKGAAEVSSYAGLVP
jgi:transposase